MGFTYYRLIVFIPASSSITLEAILEQLQLRFASQNASIVRDGKKMVIKRGTWSLSIDWEDGPHVLIESQEMADIFAKDRADKDIIAASARRLTTAGDPDPDMDYFNDYVAMIEVFESISGLIILDPDNGKFMDEM